MSRHRETVHFQFADILERLTFQELLDTSIKIPQFLLVQSVVQTEHLGAMRDFRKTFSGLAADALSRGRRRQKLGVELLQLLELAHQPVVFRIRDSGFVQNIIKVLVAAEFSTEALGFAVFRTIAHTINIMSLR